MKWRLLGGTLIVGLLAVIVIKWNDDGRSDQRSTTRTQQAAEPLQDPEIGRSMDSPGTGEPVEPPVLAGAGPLSDGEITSLHGVIRAKSDDYRARIASRRQLLAQLLGRGPLVKVLPELQAMLTDVEASEGEVMARRVAFSEANTWQANKNYEAAIQAYQLVLDRWPDSSFAVEALMHQGECRLELTNYPEAEAIFQRFVELHGDSPLAGWGWRKLALAQLLQSHFEDSLATLEVMAAMFQQTEFADYAKARRGYVLMVAGKLDQARKSYNEFLSDCPQSKYCRLVRKQLEELNQVSSVVDAKKVGT